MMDEREDQAMTAGGGSAIFGKRRAAVERTATLPRLVRAVT
jgi:hypothetical protein